MSDLEKKSIELLKNIPIEETTYQVARSVVLDYITNLQEENERYKNIFEAKERFSKIMPEDTDFIILSKADYDGLQEDIELNAIELKSRNEKAIEYINKKWKKNKYYQDVENCLTFCDFDKDDLLNILNGGDDNED